MENHDFTDWVEKHFIPFTCFKGHTCKDCPKSKGCFFEQKEERREVGKMSTNSILHNIVVEDKESAERLIDALEEAEAFSKNKNVGEKVDVLSHKPSFVIRK